MSAIVSVYEPGGGHVALTGPDQARVVRALTILARQLRNEARGRTWRGPQFADHRAELRTEAGAMERLARRLS